MSQHEVQVQVPRAVDDVEAMFAAHPADWLIGFLSLAARTGPSQPMAQRPHYRLSRPARLHSGALALAMSWSPRTGPPNFTCFNGRLLITSSGIDGTLLRLTGRCLGGTPEQNDRTVGGLLELLATALRVPAHQVADG